MANIEYLYKCYDILSEAGEKIKEHESEYIDILKAVKGSAKEKRLASQFLSKFFKHFPKLFNAAIEAQLGLCQDNDIQNRRQAIKDLPKFCVDTVGITPKIAHALAELLNLDDPLELQIVITSLQTILKVDAKGALQGIFTQIASSDKTKREKCFKFIAAKLFCMGSEVVTKNVEDYLIEKIKEILKDVSTDEFNLCMNILISTRLGTQQADLVNLLREQAQLEADIDDITIEDEIVERFIRCATHAMPYFSSQIKSTQFVIFVCDKLFPLSTWNLIGFSGRQHQVQLRLLKVFAEMCAYCKISQNASSRIDAVYIILKEYLPLPLLDAADKATQHRFQFSHVECLLYALHMLSRKHTDGLALISDLDNLKDFRSRLQYLARGTQGYLKKLEEPIERKPENDKSEENKLTSNIRSLIRGFFHSPPRFNAEIQLSWVRRKNVISLKNSFRVKRITVAVDDTSETRNQPPAPKRQKISFGSTLNNNNKSKNTTPNSKRQKLGYEYGTRRRRAAYNRVEKSLPDY